MENPPDPSIPPHYLKFCHVLCFLVHSKLDSDILISVLDTYCGLCGKQGPLTRTECCNRAICDDSGDTFLYVPSRPECAYMHDRYTVCSTHHHERHDDSTDWRECRQCRVYFADMEGLVGMGTSSFNFSEDQWDGAPSFDPTYCSKCERLIKLNSEAYTTLPDGKSSKVCQRCHRF